MIPQTKAKVELRAGIKSLGIKDICRDFASLGMASYDIIIGMPHGMASVATALSVSRSDIAKATDCLFVFVPDLWTCSQRAIREPRKLYRTANQIPNVAY